MLIKIKRQDCLEMYQTFPLRGYDSKKDEEEFYYPKVRKSYILTLSSKSFKGNVKALGTQLTKLTNALQTDTLIFLGDTDTPWLYQLNDYKPAKEAQEYLTYQKIGRRFNGAVQVGSTELPEFIKHLAWLTRCNAALPYFYFIDPKQNILDNICQYGNFHVGTVNDEADVFLSAFVKGSKFKYVDKTGCTNWFGKTNAIMGRKAEW